MTKIYKQKQFLAIKINQRTHSLNILQLSEVLQIRGLLDFPGPWIVFTLMENTYSVSVSRLEIVASSPL